MARKSSDLLDAYNEKRDFAKTKEPSGKAGESEASVPIFVVQKHDATRLHFDFRFAYEGVLKSWAVTKGPSLDPAEKRLAVRTEDHPLDYATFEGTIPEGEYGGGTVMLWDFGHWEPIEDIGKGLEKGSIKIRLFGQRMRGGWALVRMKPRKGEQAEKRESWLLIKENDADADRDRDLIGETGTSVETGRKMDEIASGRKARTKKSVIGDARPEGGDAVWHSEPGKTTPMPKFTRPQLATLVDTVPQGRDWLFELKYDGYRALAALSGSGVKLYTRNGHDWTEKFSVLVPALSKLTGGSALLDGEICAFDKDGKTDFSTLKDNLSSGGPLVFFVFDILAQGDTSLRSEPLHARKKALDALIPERNKDDPIQLSPVIREKGEDVFKAVCKAGHEGIIAKKADAPYRGGRGKSWLKIKCTLRQEFIIVGWTPSDKRKGVFASLLLATEEKGDLVYRGRVGTGFSEDDRAALQQKLDTRARKTAPLTGVPKSISKSARWVTPALLGEVAYTERTPEGALRHPSFLGLREDKDSGGVALEQPAETEADEKKRGSKGRGKAETSKLTKAQGLQAAEDNDVRMTSPDKVLFPDQNVTKARLFAYYAAIADTMLPFIADRPLSLVRCPGGRAKQCFFQKHDTGGFDDAMKSIDIAEKDGSSEDYFYLDAVAGLLAGVQMGTLEYHVWGSRRDMVEKPDRMIFDIDPDEGLDFARVKAAATNLRERLAECDLVSFPMVTGGKGIHVIVPLRRHAQWPEVKAFAAGFAKSVAGDDPDNYTATMSKAKRKGRLFIDYLRNERGATAIAPFSTRSRPGAPVAVPIDWSELETLDAANLFTLEDAVARAQRPFWAGYDDSKQALTKAMLKAVS